MTPRALFGAMGPLLAPALENAFERRDLCILATGVAIDVAQYFGVEACPLPVRLIAYNAPYARHVEDGFAGVDKYDPKTWHDGAWSVGIGCGKPEADNRWDGHLIAVTDECFGDFSLQQAERLEHGIVLGPALVGPYAGEEMWRAENNEGTVVEYCRLESNDWRNAPDWKDRARRRPIVGGLIRALRESL